MEALKIFSNPEFGQVRVIEIDNKPYAVGNDIAKILEYAEPHKAITAHCKGGITYPLLTNGGKQEVKVIPEGDIYRLIVKASDQSKNPEIRTKAERFERWIFDEVLPDIRKHGLYAKEEVIDKMLEDPDFGITLLTKYKEEKAARIEAEKAKALLMHSKKTYTTTEIAKELGFKSATAFNNDLNDKGIQFKRNGTWVLYRDYADKGYMEIKQDILENGIVIYNSHWTQTGREFLLNLYNKN
jgi:prophage antirepressor-like protein